MRLPVTSLVASLFAVLVLAAPATADHDPVRFWSVSKLEHGTGAVPVRSGAQVGGKLQQSVDVGRVVFNLPLPEPYWTFLPRDRAFGSVFSNASGAQYSVLSQAPPPNPFRIGSPNGTVTHLDESLDTTFDGDGKLTADFHGRGEFGQDVAIDAHDRIVAGGYTANGGDTEFALLRAAP
jgi:hypothetical protein